MEQLEKFPLTGYELVSLLRKRAALELGIEKVTNVKLSEYLAAKGTPIHKQTISQMANHEHYSASTKQKLCKFLGIKPLTKTTNTAKSKPRRPLREPAVKKTAPIRVVKDSVGFNFLANIK